VAENLKLNPALLSRFDIIFILLDCPDQTRDQLLSEHVIAVRLSSAIRLLILIGRLIVSAVAFGFIEESVVAAIDHVSITAFA
jgi:hypothetical protein